MKINKSLKIRIILIIVFIIGILIVASVKEGIFDIPLVKDVRAAGGGIEVLRLVVVNIIIAGLGYKFFSFMFGIELTSGEDPDEKYPRACCKPKIKLEDAN